MAYQGLAASVSMGNPAVCEELLAPFSQPSQWLRLRVSILGESLHVVSLRRFF